YERNLGGRAEMKVERGEIATEAARISPHEVRHRPEHLERERLESLLTVVQTKTEQPVRGRGGSGRHGVVVQVPRPHDQRVLIDARVEEDLSLAVPEQFERPIRKTARLIEPAPVERRLVQHHESDADERVVLEIRLDLRLPVLPGPEEPSPGIDHLSLQELGI